MTLAIIGSSNEVHFGLSAFMSLVRKLRIVASDVDCVAKAVGICSHHDYRNFEFRSLSLVSAEVRPLNTELEIRFRQKLQLFSYNEVIGFLSMV